LTPIQKIRIFALNEKCRNEYSIHLTLLKALEKFGKLVEECRKGDLFIIRKWKNCGLFCLQKIVSHVIIN